MGVMENMRFADLDPPPIVKAFSRDVRLLVLLWGCDRCL